MTQMTQMTQSEGVILNPSRRERRYCFTLNNYEKNEIDTLKSVLEKYILGYETGESGTPHIQGYCEFKNARTFDSMKKINNRISWRKCNGNQKSNLIYCSKGGDYDLKGMVCPKPLKIIQDLKPWQKKIEEIILTEPDDRTIHWFWEETGNIGKTSLIKYLLTKYEFVEFSRATKSADILSIANEEKTCYIFDFTRSQEGFCPWSAIEQLKDGLISDSKLKKVSRNLIMNCPHVIIFANWPPERGMMSLDRWKIEEIGKE